MAFAEYFLQNGGVELAQYMHIVDQKLLRHIDLYSDLFQELLSKNIYIFYTFLQFNLFGSYIIQQ